MAKSIEAQVRRAIESEDLVEFIRKHLEGGNLSIRGVAGLCGIADTSIINRASFNSLKLGQKLTEQGFSAASLTEYGFPPVAVWLTIEYFAYESKADAPLAKLIARTFGAYGVKTAFQQIECGKVISLDSLVLREPATWERRFSKSWIAEAERVTGWKWSWRVMSRFINSAVYDSFPAEIREELDRLNPLDTEGHRPSKQHQHLQNEAIAHLDARIQRTLVLMEVADNQDEFFGMLAIKDKGLKQLSLLPVQEA